MKKTASLAVFVQLIAACSAGSSIVSPANPPSDIGAMDIPFGTDATSDAVVRADAPMTDAPMMDALRITGGTGFDPRVHGFSFENYSNAPMPTNLTAAEVRRLFGNGACASLTGGTCALTPPARAWMDKTNQMMNIGHCEGMAVASQLFQQGLLSPASFQPGAATAFAIPFTNVALQRELALWWSTQTIPGLATEVCDTVVNIAARLNDGFRAGSGTVYTMAISKRDRSGGHAITPIGLEDVVPDGGVMDGGPIMANILVYDNNFPGVTHRIRITDAVMGAWSYETAQNPEASTSLYDGDNMSQNKLCLRPVNPRLSTPASMCSFCGNYAGPPGAPRPPNPTGAVPMGVAGTTTREIIMTGAADLLMVDGAGHRLGSAATGPVNEIMGASALSITSLDPSGVQAEPVYTVPEGIALSATINGSTVETMTPTELGVFGPGYSLAVNNINVGHGQIDTVTFAATGAGILYSTTQAESADVVIGGTFDGADYRFTVRTHGASGGETIAAALDSAHGELVFYFLGAAGVMNTFDLVVERTDDSGTLTFSHMGNVQPDGSILHLRYSAWTADGTPITLAVDANDDGTIDTMAMLTDETTDGGL